MLTSIIYSFQHGCRHFTLFTFNSSELYVAHVTCYNSINDVYLNADINSELFRNKNVDYIDDHIEEWFDNSEVKPKLNFA